MGVYLDKKSGKYFVQLWVKGVRTHLGQYSDKLEAENVHNCALVEAGVVRSQKNTSRTLQESFIYCESGDLLHIGSAISASYITKSGYRGITVKGKPKWLHRIIWEFFNGDIPEGMVIDHIEGKLDNRLGNLRLANRSQNQHNRGRSKNNKSGYKGVHYSAKDSVFIAQITAGNRHRYLGGFKCPIEAAKAYDNAALELHGEFASINFKQ